MTSTSSSFLRQGNRSIGIYWAIILYENCIRLENSCQCILQHLKIRPETPPLGIQGQREESPTRYASCHQDPLNHNYDDSALTYPQNLFYIPLFVWVRDIHTERPLPPSIHHSTSHYPTPLSPNLHTLVPTSLSEPSSCPGGGQPLLNMDLFQATLRVLLEI